MQIYLDEKIESIPIFKTIVKLLKEIDSSNLKFSDKYYSLEDIYDTLHLNDPVRDYVEYHLKVEGVDDPNRVNYITNALYATKGSPKVFDIIKENLSQNIYYKYQFPILDIVRLDQSRTDNVSLTINKMKDMLYYLLYYTQATIYINNVILQLTDSTKKQYITASSFGYCSYHVNSVTFDLTAGSNL